jgi:hypothetical protein
LLPETVRRKRVLSDHDENGVARERIRTLKKVSAAITPLIVMLGDPTVLVITIYNTVIFACLFFLVSKI